MASVARSQETCLRPDLIRFAEGGMSPDSLTPDLLGQAFFVANSIGVTFYLIQKGNTGATPSPKNLIGKEPG